MAARGSVGDIGSTGLLTILLIIGLGPHPIYLPLGYQELEYFVRKITR